MIRSRVAASPSALSQLTRILTVAAAAAIRRGRPTAKHLVISWRSPSGVSKTAATPASVAHRISAAAAAAAPMAAAATTTTAPSPDGNVHVSQSTQQPMLASQRAKQQRQDSGSTDEASSRRNMATFFPLGYKEAAAQWWTSISSSAAERNVISFVPFLREATSGSTASLVSANGADPFGQRIWRSSTVTLAGKNRALNELSIERVGEKVDDTLVMLHGYGAGLGFFYKNFEGLSRVPGWKLYALDMLGMGNSSRPPFKIHAKDQQGKIAEAESFFVDSLEEWRKIKKIEKFTLLGHSLGGYLAVSYALKYPGHLNKLILASPVGIPEDPYAVNAAMPEPEDSTFAAEFTQDQESITTPEANGPTKASGGDKNTLFKTRGNPKEAAKPERRPIPPWLSWLWDQNVSPFSVVRASGPLGPRLVSGWTSRRFNHLPPDEAQALHTYSYSLFRQRGSGEYALTYLLAPGAFARSPVINRIQNVGRQVVRPATDAGPEVRETGFPVVFMYGDKDWMDVAGGYAAEEKLKQRAVQALLHGTDEEKGRENGSAKVVVVQKAGHHLYLDNPDEFNEILRKELEETRAWGQRQRATEQ